MRVLLGETLQDHLRETLGSAHDIGRAHSLVGGDQHEGFHPGLAGRLRRVPGSEDIVGNALGDIVFHHGHMLVGRGVIDRLHTKGAKYALQALLVLDGAQQGDQFQFLAGGSHQLAQLALDVVQGVFGVIQQQQFTRTGEQNLPAELRADGTAGAGYHHHLARYTAIDELRMGGHRVAPQQIVQADILDLDDTGLARYQLVDPRHRTHVDGQAHQGIDDLLAALGGGRGNRQQYLGDVMLGDELLQFPGVGHLQAVDHRVLQGRVIIDKDHYPVLVALVQGGEQLASRFTRSVNDHVV